MKLIILFVLLSCGITAQAQNQATQIVGSIFEGIGKMLTGIGNAGQAVPALPLQTQANPLQGIIQLIIKMFTGLINPQPKPDIASTIPKFPIDLRSSFPGGESSFPSSPFDSSTASTTPAPAAGGGTADFEGLDDFLNS